MRFIIGSEEDFIEHLGQKLESLIGRPLTLFVSGGSAILPEAKIIARLAKNSQVKNLTILPVDERYGPPMHADANISTLAKLLPENVQIVDILKGQDLVATEANFQQLFKQHSEDCHTIAILGLGSDGHTAGILPGSPADLNSRHDVVTYDSTPYIRITLTASALQKIDQIFVFAFGPTKHEILELLAKNPSNHLPMDLFRTHQNVTIFTDNQINYKGEKS